MIWRHHVRRVGRHTLRLLLLLLVLAAVLLATLLTLLGSETGSRWLLARGMSVQQTLTARYQGGTILTGLDLADFRFHTARTDLRVRRVVARWSLWHLLRGEVLVHRLQGQGMTLRRLAPPDDKRGLPTFILPLRLTLREGAIDDIRYWSHGATQPRTLRRLEVSGDWLGSRVGITRLHAEQDRLGALDLTGWIRLRGGYPLAASGRFDYRAFREKGWQPLVVTLGGKVEDLEIGLQSAGGLTAKGQGRIRPLEPELPFEAALEWQTLRLPWWSDLELASKGGRFQAKGTRAGLRGEGSAQLSGRNVPAGQYDFKGTTNWRSARFESLLFSGLGGKAQVAGEVGWHQMVSWKVSGKAQRIDPSRHWNIPSNLVPPISGAIDSSGHTNKGDVAVNARLRLDNGERWDIAQTGASWPWNLDAPQRLSASWANVRRQLGGQNLFSADGELEAEGTRQDYWLVADARLAGSRFPEGRWSAEVGGARRTAGAAHVEYRGDAGGLVFDGTLALGVPLRWDGTVVLEDFRTAWLSPKWSGQFSGALEGNGQWGGEAREMQWRAVHVEGLLRDLPFRLDGPLDIALPEADWPELRSPGLTLQWGNNRVIAMGGLKDEHWDLAARLDIADPGQLLPGWRGKVRGEVGLQGPERRPDLQASLAGEGIGKGAWTARSGQLQANVVALGEAESRVGLTLDGLVTESGEDWGRLHLDLDGTRAAHRLGWSLEGERLGSQGRLAGAQAGSDWSGRMEEGRVSLADMQWQLDAPYALEWRQAPRQARLAAHCWTSGEARFCNEAEMLLGSRGSVQLSLEGLDLLQLRELLPEGLELSGKVDGEARGAWQPGEPPALRAGLAARGGEFRLAREGGQPPLVMSYDRLALSAEAGTRSVGLQLDLESRDMGQGHVTARLDPYTEGKPMQGQLDLDGVRLEILQPFFPALTTLAGKVSARGNLDGNLAQPDFRGAVQVREGQMAFQRLPIQIHDIESTIEVAGRQAAIHGTMRSGEGTATLEGSADWSAAPRLDLALKGSRFRLSQPPELLAEVDPDLRLQIVGRRADLTGTIRVPMARLNLKPLTARAVPLSPDIRVVRAADREGVVVTGNVADWDVNADILLLLGDDVYFQGYGVHAALLGGLRLHQEGKRGLEAHGDVELGKEARYDAYGQRLEIRRGRLIFAGNLTQPGLDVEAIREVDNKVVGVRMQGRANAPEATLFSDTSMSQEEIVSYLVLGRPLDTSGRPDTGAGNMTAAAAAIKLGATGGAGLTSKVGETFGISDFAVDAEGSGDDTQFTVSGYISPRLYIRYGVGIFTPVNTATVRYKISSRLYLEAVSSLESAIDLFYNLRF